MPIGFDLNFPQIRRQSGLATPPFVPQGSVPAMSSPEDDPDLVPSSAASKELQDLIAARQRDQLAHPPSLKRRILGTVISGWAPQIGQEIADPGLDKFHRQAELLKQKTQLEDAALDRRYKIENIQSGIANRQELRRQAQQKLDEEAQARNTADATARDKMGQMVVNPEFMKFESAAPLSTSITQPQQYGPPTRANAASWSPTPPAQQYGPPAPPPPPPLDSPEGPDYRNVAQLPLRSELGTSGPHKETTAAVRPDGTYQVSSTEYDPKGSIRVQKTPGQIAKEKWESSTIETPQDILEVFPDSAKRMSENAILGFRNAIIRKDEGAAARLAAQERANEANATKLAMQDSSNSLRRELAANSADLARDLAANRGSGRPTTGAERQALAYYNRAQSALNDLQTPGSNGEDSLEDRIAKAGSLTQAGLKLPAIMQNADQQKYTQAQRAFTEARLRKESGAAIPEHEIENDAVTYFAQPGDTPEVKAQKKAARQAVLDGLAFSSGKAYEEFFGEPLQTPAAKAKGANGAPAALAPSGTKKYQQTRKGTDGKSYGWSPGMSNWEVIQ